MTSSRGSRVQYNCSFCGKNQDQVKRLIAGPGAVYICDECVELCREIIDEEVSGSIHPKSTSQRQKCRMHLRYQLCVRAERPCRTSCCRN